MRIAFLISIAKCIAITGSLLLLTATLQGLLGQDVLGQMPCFNQEVIAGCYGTNSDCPGCSAGTISPCGNAYEYPPVPPFRIGINPGVFDEDVSMPPREVTCRKWRTCEPGTPSSLHRCPNSGIYPPGTTPPKCVFDTSAFICSDCSPLGWNITPYDEPLMYVCDPGS